MKDFINVELDVISMKSEAKDAMTPVRHCLAMVRRRVAVRAGQWYDS